MVYLAFRHVNIVGFLQKGKRKGIFDMTRVAYVIPRLNNAGPVNHLYELVRCLNRREFEIKIVTLYSEGKDSRYKDFTDLEIDVSSLNISQKFSFGTICKMLNEEIKKINPDLVHSEGLPADIACLFLDKKKVKWCSTIHCNIYMDYKLMKYGIFNIPFFPQIMIKVHEYCLKKVDLLIACSYTLESIYKKTICSEVCAVQNGINEDKFESFEYKKYIKTREKMNIDKDKIIAVIVGSIDERKNSKLIISALKSLTKEFDFQLIFLGEGKLLKECMCMAEGYDIQFMGKVNNVTEYLYCSDIYISASRSEGLPLSVLEAGVCGLELILSDIPQHREIFKKESIYNPAFFNYDNQEELANKVKESIHNVRGKNRICISEYFRKNFNAKKMADEYTALYEKILNK